MNKVEALQGLFEYLPEALIHLLVEMGTPAKAAEKKAPAKTEKAPTVKWDTSRVPVSGAYAAYTGRSGKTCAVRNLPGKGYSLLLRTKEGAVIVSPVVFSPSVTATVHSITRDEAIHMVTNVSPSTNTNVNTPRRYTSAEAIATSAAAPAVKYKSGDPLPLNLADGLKKAAAKGKAEAKAYCVKKGIEIPSAWR